MLLYIVSLYVHVKLSFTFFMIYNLSEKNSIANQFLLELRDKNLQQDRMRFRKNMERLGEIMAYEISQRLSYKSHEVETPLAKTTIPVFEQQPVLISVLRAGIPYFQGFLNFFDRASSGFIGACRQEGEENITINLDYISSPSLEGQTVILIDPMLATGKSFIKSIDFLKRYGKPVHIHLAALVSSPEGIDFIKRNVNDAYTLWTFSIDKELNSKFYIVPGLGDAGDLSYGEKI